MKTITEFILEKVAKDKEDVCPKCGKKNCDCKGKECDCEDCEDKDDKGRKKTAIKEREDELNGGDVILDDPTEFNEILDAE